MLTLSQKLEIRSRMSEYAQRFLAAAKAPHDYRAAKHLADFEADFNPFFNAMIEYMEPAEADYHLKALLAAKRGQPLPKIQQDIRVTQRPEPKQEAPAPKADETPRESDQWLF